MILAENRKVVIPFVTDIYKEIPVNLSVGEDGIGRAFSIFTLTNVGGGKPPLSEFTSTTVDLLYNDWVEVFVDGKRLLNPRLYNDIGGTVYENYNLVSKRKLVFSNPITEWTIVKIIIDPTIPSQAEESVAAIINVDNVQGFKSKGISIYHEPVVMTLPENGYARLTLDRKSIMYVPNYGFSGVDQFNYCIINSHGQQSRNRCIRIKVG